MPHIAFRGVELTVPTPTDSDPRAASTILGPIDLDLTERRIGIIGANGSGKSTLARTINGLVTPTAGEVTVDGDSPRRARRRIGFVFFDAENQIIMPQVRDDVLFSLRRSTLSKAERQAKADAALDRFHLADHAEDSPHTLSGGQKQLLALASVTVLDPDLIIADEPTTLLDLRNRLRIAEEFAALEQQLIVVTHDLELLRDFDRVICLDRGRVIADGSSADTIPAYVERMRAAHDAEGASRDTARAAHDTGNKEQ